MHRRSLLAGTCAVSTAVAGCIDELDGDGNGESGDGDENGGNEDGGDSGPEENGDAFAEATVDEPPYEIDPSSFDDDEWDEHYLGAKMDTEPSLAFERLDLGAGALQERPLVGLEIDHDSASAAVQLIDSSGAERELLTVDEDDRPVVDYDEYLLAVVHSGWGSGSKAHRWRRVEETDDGVHLHGYYLVPPEQTDDLSTRQSVVRIERPFTDDLSPTVTVSLTVDESRRVTFDSTEDAFLAEGTD